MIHTYTYTTLDEFIEGHEELKGKLYNWKQKHDNIDYSLTLISNHEEGIYRIVVEAKEKNDDGEERRITLEEFEQWN